MKDGLLIPLALEHTLQHAWIILHDPDVIVQEKAHVLVAYYALMQAPELNMN